MAHTPARPPKRYPGAASTTPGGRVHLGSRPDTAPRGSEYLDTTRNDPRTRAS
ncbi:hypothetical protein DWB77_05459 [Streptomyces hundungensis]|uniref:Uncharacterized protein n=1 Tax=Streptomyces hundungensis TaxID=1077946 RepID=A0A387HLW6_9ACTN|nr:hypothetical protein [Streptomyces hundungensis]AYG83263.1 hypothetical protein DWB77_05459 [Streptomyces hundungensis]